jgi:methyl-accepting chemotaxis protein
MKTPQTVPRTLMSDTLANQTAKATEDISQQIENIQSETGSAVAATESITNKVEEINGVTSTIAAAIEQQNAATQEVGQNINQVSDASIETERMAKDTLGAAGELATKSDELQGHINKFMENLGVKN